MAKNLKNVFFLKISFKIFKCFLRQQILDQDVYKRDKALKQGIPGREKKRAKQCSNFSAMHTMRGCYPQEHASAHSGINHASLVELKTF